MKNYLLVSTMAAILYASAPLDLIGAENPGEASKNRLPNQDLSALSVQQLMEIKRDICLNEGRWDGESMATVNHELLRRKDPKLDRQLIALFSEVLSKDEKSDPLALDPDNPKRPATASERLLAIIAMRGTSESTQFVISQTTNQYVVIRLASGRCLAKSFRGDQKNQSLLKHLLPLLDEDPFIASHVAYVLVGSRFDSPLLEEQVARRLLEGKRRAKQQTTAKLYQSVINTYREQLDRHTKRAREVELKQINTIRAILNSDEPPKP